MNFEFVKIHDTGAEFQVEYRINLIYILKKKKSIEGREILN